MSFGCRQANLLQSPARKLSKLSYHLHFHGFASMDFQHRLKDSQCSSTFF